MKAVGELGGREQPESGVIEVAARRYVDASEDLRAHRLLYELYLPLVRRTAMQLARRLPRHVSLDDLLGAGWVGLVEALRRRGAIASDEQFEQYAAYRVRGAILDYLRSLDPMTRRMRGASRRITAAIRALTARLTRAPTEQEIAATLGIALEVYHALLHEVARCDPSRIELSELYAPRTANDTAPDAIASRMQLADQITCAVAAMPERLQLLLALYYHEECTFREIGQLLGLTEARISQLHTEAIHRLRAHIEREEAEPA